MGAVFQAIQTPIERTVALKTLHLSHAGNKSMVTRFLNEAKALGKLQHPNVVQVIDYGTTSAGVAYLVMEFLRGETLSRRLQLLGQHRATFPLLSTLQLGFQVADALAFAHANGIVHRDLKPDNLMLVRDAIAPGGERVKILDFGIAKLTDKDSQNIKTATQAIMGTPMYMSPEQCQGAGKVDTKTDVYSLGCVLYESLCGFPPFVAEGHGEIIAMHLFQEPVPIKKHVPKVPDPIAGLVHRMLAKNKSQRPSMSEAADELGAIILATANPGPLFRTPIQQPLDVDATHPRAAPPNTFGNARGQMGAFAGVIQRRWLPIGGFLILAVLFLSIVGWKQVDSNKRIEPALTQTNSKSVVIEKESHTQTAQAPLNLLSQVDQLPTDQPNQKALSVQKDIPSTESVSKTDSKSQEQKTSSLSKAISPISAHPKSQHGSSGPTSSFIVIIKGANGDPAIVLRNCASTELKDIRGLPDSYQINLERSGALHVVDAPTQVYHTDFQKCVRNGLKTLPVSMVPQSVTLSIRSGR
jgi:serine/threonine protein kinase